MRCVAVVGLERWEIPRPAGDEIPVLCFPEVEKGVWCVRTDRWKSAAWRSARSEAVLVESGACAGRSKPSWSSLGEGLRDENMGRLGVSGRTTSAAADEGR